MVVIRTPGGKIIKAGGHAITPGPTPMSVPTPTPGPTPTPNPTPSGAPTMTIVGVS